MKKAWLSLIPVVLMSMLLAGAIPAYAFADDVSYDEPYVQPVYFDKSGNADSKSYTYYSYSGKTTSYKVDNASVATASFKNFKTKDGYGTCCTVKFKKAGKVNLTRKYIDNESGESRDGYEAYETVAYKPSVKTLKIGGTDLSKKVKHSRVFTGKAFKGKVSFTLNKGWKLDRLYKFKTSELKKPGNVKQTTLKKGKAFKLNKGERLVIMCKKGKKAMSVVYTAK